MTTEGRFDMDIPAEQSALIEELMHLSARWLLADPDPHRFVDRMAQEGPRRFAALFDEPAGAPGAAVAQAQFFRSFGWAIASAMPLPSQGFVARKLPLPGRNEPCICGSLRKFKHCCAPAFEQLPVLEPQGLGTVMLLEMPRNQWKSLPATRVAPGMVLAAALSLADEGEPRAAIALLEPWTKPAAPWNATRAPLLDFLCDLYLDENHPRKREKLARAMVANGDVVVQSAGWRRLSMMAADAGNTIAAQDAFERAQRLTPDDPDVALLEVTTLLGSGQRERAAERAAFHARRLARLPQAEALADEIAVFEKMGRGEFPPLPGQDDEAVGPGNGDIVGVLEPDSPFHQLERWAQSLPPPKLRLMLAGSTPQDMGVLLPSAAMAAPLARWRKAFDVQLPEAAWQTVGPEALEVFVNERWSALLQRDPRLADCFEVLDGLVQVLDLVPLGLAAALQARLLTRALDLWQQLLQRFPSALCEWAHLGNRPALRLMARRAQIDADPRAEASLRWLQALVEVLNPHDNHGFRERLAAVYLRRGEAAAAAALCTRYPDDFVGMQLLHTRALLAQQHLPEAAKALRGALKTNGHVAALLTSRRAPKPPDVDRFSVGSLEEARISVGRQHDLWRDPGVQKWLGQQLAPQISPGLFDDADA